MSCDETTAARPSSPLGSTAAAAAGHKVQFAAASTVLDEVDDAGDGGGTYRARADG